MKKCYLIIVMLFSVFIINGQNSKTINWINENAIEIEDANPDSELNAFKNDAPRKFSNAKIFGFGEASHNTKEFFDIKAKFFKYLVRNQGVKTFIMEESYQAESGINEWISGGKGDIKTIAKHFNIGFWKTKEVVNLLQWMRDYNSDKSKENQIRFYGMDIQSGKNINQEIRDFVKKHKISVDEKLLMVADNCSNKKKDYTKSTNWAKFNVPELEKLKQTIIKSQTDRNINQIELKSIIRSLNYLKKYTQHISSSLGFVERNEFRDLKMFENIKWIVEKESKNGKAFIWAHNEHINKKEMYSNGSGIMNLGRYLKDYYSNDYYSVGFDFGKGNIYGYARDKKQGAYWKNYYIEKPFRKTFAKTLIFINKDIYFVDMDNALANEPTKFFSKKLKHLLIAAGGYQPKPLHKILISKIYNETYDGLIFVKKISAPEYNLDK